MNMSDELFSPDPRVRLQVATKGAASIDDAAVPTPENWLVNSFGARNAWLLVVGPSPGTGPGGKVDHPVLPVLGRVLPEFEQFAKPSNDRNGFWRELFRLLRDGFKHAGLLPEDRDAVLKLTLAMNLDTTPQGDGSKVTREMLRRGVSRLARVVHLAQPRVILALKADVYEVIQEWWNREIGKTNPENAHDPVLTRKQRFYGKSIWMSRENGSPILLVKILQHPSRASLYRGYESLFSNYLGDRFAEAADIQNPD